MIWLRKYNKENKLESAIKFTEDLSVKSFYKTINENKFISANNWGDIRLLDVRESNQKFHLEENFVGEKFFRCVKSNENGNLELPEFNKKFSIENGSVMNFNVKNETLIEWKRIIEKSNS